MSRRARQTPGRPAQAGHGADETTQGGDAVHLVGGAEGRGVGGCGEGRVGLKESPVSTCLGGIEKHPYAQHKSGTERGGRFWGRLGVLLGWEHLDCERLG